MKRAAVILAALFAAPASADEANIRDVPPACIGTVQDAFYEGETTRYAHGVLGDAIEYEQLTVVVVNDRQDTSHPCAWWTNQMSVELPRSLVFEDIAPRLSDLDGDGTAEIITIESSLTHGARLAVWGRTEDGFARVATTPHIGQRNRWLAPIGAADLDGDGYVEIAYVDRPHLAKRLRVWRFVDGDLVHVADLDGLSNHRIGEDFISGGIRDCGAGPEMITADATWRRIMMTRFENGGLRSRDIGPFDGPHSFAQALECE